MKNNKGFTLVELLAVIVILAVIILIAVNAVIPQMNKAKKNSFIDEVAVYAQAAEKAYVSDQISDSNPITCFTVGSSGANELNGNFVKKADTQYKGKVLLNSDGSLKKIYLKNKNYMVVAATQAKVDAKTGDDATANSVKTYKASDWDSTYAACQTGE